MTYHHGDLRRALLIDAAELVSEQGPERLSLRALAARAGVSHAAPAHHFGDRAGLFTALAAEGFDLLATELESRGDDLLEQAVAYVEFALAHRGHFATMFEPTLVRADDPALVAARARARTALQSGLTTVSEGDDADRTAAFSLVHGFATLWLAGALAEDVRAQDPGAVTRRMASRLFRDRGSSGS